MKRLALAFLASLPLLLAAAPSFAGETATPAPAPVHDADGDLFPTPGHVSLAGATGLPFLGIGEVGIGVTRGFSIGVIGGITPSVLTAGIRPRFRVRLNDSLALMLNVPMLYYPSASAPGPGNIGSTTWVLARPELMLDGTFGDRFHFAGGMGIVAAASTLALGNKIEGKDFAVPAYSGSPQDKMGFAGGIWNTLAFHSSYALGERTRLFMEGSLILSGVALADNVGGPPVVITAGVQHTL